MTAVRGLLIAAVLLWLPAAAPAQELPTLTGPVNDFAGVIDESSEAAIDARSRALLAASGDTIVVVTVPTIAGFSIEEYAVRLFEQAGIGSRAEDNGLLILLAVEEREVRVEVGYGLEPIVTDGYAGEVIRTRMVPAFRQNDYGGGLLAAVTTLAQRIAAQRNVTVDGLPAEPQPALAEGPDLMQVAVIVIILLFVILNSRRGGGGGRGFRRYRRGPFWYGGLGGFGGGFGGFGGGGGGFGGRGGGFGGFGGGRSGGGGASGGW